MPTFTTILAFNVPVYGTVEIEADTIEEALEKARAAYNDDNLVKPEQPEDWVDLWADVYDVDWSAPSEARVVSIENDENPSDIIDGIDLMGEDFRIITREKLTEAIAEYRAWQESQRAKYA